MKPEEAIVIILKDAMCSYIYARDVIEGRWEQGEAAISKSAYYSYLYARDVIKGRLPDLIHNQMLLNNHKYTKLYVELLK